MNRMLPGGNCVAQFLATLTICCSCLVSNAAVFQQDQAVALTARNIRTHNTLRPAPAKETITLSARNVSLAHVFRSIYQQTKRSVFYSADQLNDAETVSVNFNNTPLDEALTVLLRGKRLAWEYRGDRDIVLKPVRETPAARPDTVAVNVLSGSVSDENGTPLPGATVVVKGTKRATATDGRGRFVLKEVEERASLVVSFTGYEKQEVGLNGGNHVNVKLNMAVNALDEAVVVAYNTTTQRATTGAVTVVKGKQIESLPNRSFDKSLQGLVPGLLVTGGTGQPGGGVSNFVLRGIGTAGAIGYGSSVRNPLIIVDGVPVTQEHAQLYMSQFAIPVNNPLAQLNPSDIESISVLKDASAVALYGSRASNGVIVITTKKGKSGKTIFGFRHQTDIATKLDGKLNLLTQQEYLELLYESYKNADPSITDKKIKEDLQSKFPTRSDGSFYPTPDWDRELFTDRAVTVSNELSMSGGNDRSNFYLNLEYTKQNGVIKRTGYDRKSLRFNFENHPASWLKLGFNTTLSYNVQQYGGSHSGPGGPLSEYFSPLNPVRLADGSYVMNYDWGSTLNPQSNPVAAADLNINRNTAFRGLGKIYGEVNFLNYFTFTSNLGFDYMQSEAKEKVDPRLFDPEIFSIEGRIEEQSMRRANVITTNILRFDKTFGADHVLGLVAGQEAQILSQKFLAVAVKGLDLPYYEEIGSPGVTVYKQGGAATKETLLSIFGQANYGFKNKYFLSASVRRDGSSRFGEARRFGTYWSTGAGWVVTSEPFMSGSTTWLSYLKIRGSVGSAGNAAAINTLTRFDQLLPTIHWNDIAVYPNIFPANPNVRWEQTFSWDAGIEARFLQDRISVTADIYRKLTKDLLYNVRLPLNTGYTSVLSNIGKMRNNGVELTFIADIIKTKDFRWNLNANWSMNRNILAKADVPLPSIGTDGLGNEEGRNFNSFYTKLWAGVNLADGRPQWIDSAGKVTSDYDLAKREFVGKPQPDGFGAISNTFSFKNIELSAMLYYQYGYQIYDEFLLTNDGYMPYLNQDRRALDRWRKQGDYAANPRRILDNTDGGTRQSTRYLFDGDHIRLQNVTLAYNFPKRMLDRLHLSMLKVFVQGQNLAIWTKFPGKDPSNVNTIGQMTDVYPNQRIFSVGLNANF